MNLLDYRVTSPQTVADRVEAEALARGATVMAWELVGCAPADAWRDWRRTLAVAPSRLLSAELFAASA